MVISAFTFSKVPSIIFGIGEFQKLTEIICTYGHYPENCCRSLVDTIKRWVKRLKLPQLSKFGVQPTDLDRILAGTSNKNNPVRLNQDEIKKGVYNYDYQSW